MQITIDRHRIIHLCVLVGVTVLGGQWLIRQWEWQPLSAYGCSCTLVTQLSNAVWTMCREQQTQQHDTGHHATAAKPPKPQQRGNPKKKKQQQHKTKGKIA